MKRILYIVSVFAALALAGCRKEETAEDSIQISPENAEAEYLPGSAETTVTSSGEWTIEGNYTWVTPSATKGVSGDKVTFNYNVNTSGKDRAALFKLRCGSAYANFALRQDSGVITMTATLEKVSAVSGEYVFKLNVVSPEDIGKFVKWGLRWSTDAATVITEGTDVAIDGTPVEGDTEVTVRDLPNDYNYFFVGWLEMSDGTRSYTEGDPVTVFIASDFESEVEMAGINAHQATCSYEIGIPGLQETGICLDFTEDNADPTIDNCWVKIACDAEELPVGRTVEMNTLAGASLFPESGYSVRAYAVRSDGETVYGPVTKFTTLEDPWNSMVLDDSYPADYSRFQSLCEFGPVKQGSWDASQSVTTSASDVQSNFRRYWNTALTSYGDSKYAALFSELVFLKNSAGKTVMQNIVWREGAVGENDPKEANRVGGFSYVVNYEDGFFSCTPDNYAFVPDDSWAVKEQGMQTSEIVDIFDGASNQGELKTIKSYWASHSFFLDWGETKTLGGAEYREILLYADIDGYKDVFCFRPACFGAAKYDAESHEAATTWSLYVGEGTSVKYDLTELSTGGYYLRLNEPLAGKTVRISKSSGGYPAYIPDGNGKFRSVNSASDGTYTVPTANKWANKCAVSFSFGGNVCVVKDICVLSDTCFPCGDEIKLPDGYSDWNAETSYKYFKTVGFFAPTDKLYEPHIYRIDVTFKAGGNEGFKVLRTNNFTKGGYNSAVQSPPDNNPVDKWLGVNVTTGDSSTGDDVPDWKWKPNASGDYTIELDLSAMQLRVVKR